MRLEKKKTDRDRETETEREADIQIALWDDQADPNPNRPFRQVDVEYVSEQNNKHKKKKKQTDAEKKTEWEENTSFKNKQFEKEPYNGVVVVNIIIFLSFLFVDSFWIIHIEKTIRIWLSFVHWRRKKRERAMKRSRWNGEKWRVERTQEAKKHQMM
jgi:hypothetical protein